MAVGAVYNPGVASSRRAVCAPRKRQLLRLLKTVGNRDAPSTDQAAAERHEQCHVAYDWFVEI